LKRFAYSFSRRVLFFSVSILGVNTVVAEQRGVRRSESRDRSEAVLQVTVPAGAALREALELARLHHGGSLLALAAVYAAPRSASSSTS
jgi:hypothetical protein